MAQVPTSSGPSVLNTTNAGSDYQQVNSTPAAFGAGIGQAEGQLGAQIGQAGQDAGNVALMQQGIVNETDALNASAKHAGAQATLQGNYMALSGQAAVDARPVYMQQLTDLRAQTLSSVSNPAAQREVAQDIQRQYNMAQSAGAEHYAQQLKVSVLDASKDKAAAQTNLAMGNRTNPSAVDQLAGTRAEEMQRQAVIMGWDKDKTTSVMQQSNGEIYGNAIRGLLTDNNPMAAQAMFNANRGKMDATSQVQLAEAINPAVQKYTVDARIQSITNQGGPIVNAGPITSGADFQALRNAQKTQESGNRQFVSGTNQPLESMPGNPDSPVGISQIKPSTAAGIAQQVTGAPLDAQRLRNDTAYNDQLGTAYMQQQVDRFRDPNLALIAYNAGPGMLTGYTDKSGNHVPGLLNSVGDPRTGAVTIQQLLAAAPAETQKYVASIGAHMNGASGQGTPVAANDKGAVMQRAMDATANDTPEVRQAVMGRTASWLNDQDSMLNQQRRNLSQNLSDLKPQLLQGAEGLTIPENDIRRLSPDQQTADRTIADLHLSQTAGALFKGVANATPQDIAANQQQLLSGQGLLPGLLRAKVGYQTDGSGNVISGPGGDTGQAAVLSDMKTRQQVAGMYQELIDKRTSAIKADPAAYAIQNDPGVKAAAADAQGGDPTAFSTYAQATLAAQTRLGVPSYNQRILSGPQVQSTVQQLMQGDPAKVDIGKQVDKVTSTYGDNWPTVYHQLVVDGHMPAAWQTVATMGAPSQTAARSDLVRAVQAQADKGGAGEFEKLVPEAAKTSINQGIDAALQPFMGTSTNLPANTVQMNGVVRDSVKQLAQYYSMQGMDGGSAVTKAADMIVGQKYDIDGTVRTPKGMMGQVQTAISKTNSAIKPEDLADPGYTRMGTGQDITPLQRQGIVAGASKTWMTNEKDDGVVMLANLKDGSKLPVLRADGSRVELKFKDIASSSPTDGAFHPGANFINDNPASDGSDGSGVPNPAAPQPGQGVR